MGIAGPHPGREGVPPARRRKRCPTGACPLTRGVGSGSGSNPVVLVEKKMCALVYMRAEVEVRALEALGMGSQLVRFEVGGGSPRSSPSGRTLIRDTCFVGKPGAGLRHATRY